MEQKVIVVNFVAKHSYVFIKNMIEGLANNNCKVFAIVSKNMEEIHEWRMMKNVELYEVDGYTKVTTFPIKLFKLYKRDARYIRKRIKELNASVIYIPICTYWTWFVNLILRDLPFVYAIHDPVSHSDRISIIGIFNYLLGRRAKRVIIFSELFRPHVKRCYRKSEKQIVTIPGGYENVEIKDKNIHLVKYDDSKINFLFQGRIDKYKGLVILAEAFEMLRKKYDNVTLTVAGAGDFKPYKNIFDRLSDCTVINRWLTNDEVNSLFNDRSVITVLPYISATQSGVINVAMPNGSPIIATRCGGIIEQIDDNKTGYLIEPNNVNELYEKMEYVLNHRDELDTIRNNAYARMKTLEWDVLAARVVEIL